MCDMLKRFSLIIKYLLRMLAYSDYTNYLKPNTCSYHLIEASKSGIANPI